MKTAPSQLLNRTGWIALICTLNALVCCEREGASSRPTSWYTTHRHHQAEVEGVAEQMDLLHLQKIEMADDVFVVNIDGYVGDSTKREIKFAESLGKPVHWLEPC